MKIFIKNALAILLLCSMIAIFASCKKDPPTSDGGSQDNDLVTPEIADNQPEDKENIPDDNKDPIEEIVYTEGLSYSLSNDETYYFVSVGECTDNEYIAIPPEHEGLPVKVISHDGFENCKKLKEVRLPSSLVAIYDFAFQGCTALESIVIPKSVNQISIGAFLDCTGLKQVVFEEGSELISISGFSGCKNLTEIDLPYGLQAIGHFAFVECGFEEILIPETVNGIGMLAFSGAKLKTITIPDSVEIIADGAFSGCNQLSSVKIGSGLKSLDEEVFSGCKALKKIDIPIGIEKIGSRVFENCTSLITVNFEEKAKIQKLDISAFSYCESLEEINIPKSVTDIVPLSDGRGISACINIDPENKTYKSIDGVIYSKDGKTLYHVSGHRSGGAIKVADGTENINMFAMSYMTISVLELPGSLKQVFYFALLGASVADVYYHGTAEQWQNVFVGSSNNALQNATIHFVE